MYSSKKSQTTLFQIKKTNYYAPLGLVEFDLWGPSHTISRNEFRYYITFVDMFSHRTWIYFLQSKSEALKSFLLFKKQVENQFNTKIKSLQTDGGGEYRSFTPILKISGIIH